jgi:hypothetical protein
VTPSAETPSLAGELVRLAVSLEPMSGEGRSAAVWALDSEPRLVYAGPNALEGILAKASERLGTGEEDFELHDEPGVRGRVLVCRVGNDRAAYGLFLQGAGQPHLGDTLHQLIRMGEASIGKPAAQMSRTEKQRLVRFLDDRGAFLIRRAVEEVADRLGVTRFTIYNYLDRERADLPSLGGGGAAG